MTLGDEQTLSASGIRNFQQRAYYPSPFFDVAQLYMPNNIKDLFKWCRFYFYTHPILYRVCTKLTEYPITEIVPEVDPSLKQPAYEELIQIVKMKNFLVEFGLDYYVYGNCFVSVYFPFTRMLKCPTCSLQVNIKDAEFKVQNYQLRGTCVKCNTHVTYEIVDLQSSDRNRIRLIRWNPVNVHIEHNEISGESEYYLSIPSRIRKGITEGNPLYWRTTPMEHIEAIKAKKWIVFNEGKIFHFKNSSLSDENSEWGKPALLPVLREIFHLYTLRKGQEAIAIDRIIPLKFLYPLSQSANVEPLYNVDLGKWRAELEKEIRKWKYDPLHISIMPFPIGEGNLGGDGKALMVFQEMEATAQMIENGLGMPSGFMSGRMTYSGGNVTLRMLENSIITYRDQLVEFINWSMGQITSYLKIPKAKFRMQDFKMADDMSRRQLLAELNSAGKISNDTFLKELNISFETEIEKSLQEESDKHKRYLQVQVDLESTIRGYINEIIAMEDDIRNHVLSKMQQEMPETYNLVAQRLQVAQSVQPTPNEAAGIPEQQGAPMQPGAAQGGASVTVDPANGPNIQGPGGQGGANNPVQPPQGDNANM